MDEQEKELRERELLAGFHATMAGQLDSRLAESPRFFALVVVALTACGFVTWNWEPKHGRFVLVLASASAYIVILWAIWYLAALSYAFRFLQYSLHRSEERLGWQQYRLSDTWEVSGAFGLSPGIYLQIWQAGCALAILAVALLAGFGWAYGVNRHYATQFNEKVSKKRSDSASHS